MLQHRQHQQCEGSESLLPIDDVEGLLIIRFEDEVTHVVCGFFLRKGTQKVGPKVFPLFFTPTVTTPSLQLRAPMGASLPHLDSSNETNCFSLNTLQFHLA